MTFKEFDDFADEIIKEVRIMKDTKGKEYANGTDRLLNFKEVANESGLDSLQVWHVYFKKHIRSIDSYVKTRKVFSESIQGRIVDAITYLLLGAALIEESKIILPICSICHNDIKDNWRYCARCANEVNHVSDCAYWSNEPCNCVVGKIE